MIGWLLAALLAQHCGSVRVAAPLAVRAPLFRAPPPRLVFAPRRTDDGYTYACSDARAGSEAWVSNLLSTTRSRVLERISGHLVTTCLVATAVASAFAAARADLLPPSLTDTILACELPAFPHETVGSFIALLLAFRTGQVCRTYLTRAMGERVSTVRVRAAQAYDRFWEGRTLWDGVFTECRGLVRLLSAFDASSPRARALFALTTAWPYALKQHLRGERDLDELLGAAADSDTGGIAAKEIRAAADEPNVPLGLIRAMTRTLVDLKSGGHDLVWWQCDFHIAGLSAILAKAERVKGTPVPLSYSRHTSRFFSVYAFTLPLALVPAESSPWLMPPTTAIVAWVLFATEEIGHIIEEPFGRGLADDPDSVPDSVSVDGEAAPDSSAQRQLEVLPLGRYCAEIAADVGALLGVRGAGDAEGGAAGSGSGGDAPMTFDDFA